MATTTWYVEAKFDGTNWTDITSFVRAVNVKRGRPNDLDAAEAGNAVVVLNNGDGRFTPENSQGAYTPNVKPGVPVRIQVAGGTGVEWDSSTEDWDDSGVTWDGLAVRTQIVGEAVSWEPQWSPSAVDTVVLEVVDGFEQLNNFDLRAPYSEEVDDNSPDGYWKLGEASGDFEDSSGNGHTLMPSGAADPTISRGGSSLVALGTGSVTAELRGVADEWFPIVSKSTVPAAWNGDANDLTLSLMVRFGADDGSLVTLVDFRGSTGAVDGIIWSLARSDLGSLDFRIYSGPTEDILSSDVLTWTVDTTYHLLVHWDLSTSTATFFRNGTNVGSSTASILSAPATTTRPFINVAQVGGVSEVDLTFSDLVLWTSDQSSLASTLSDAADGYPSDTPSDRIGRVLDWAGWDASDRSLDTGTTPLAAITAGTALSACQDAASADGGVFYISRTGLATFQGRRSRWEDDSTVTATFDDDGTDTRYQTTGWRFDKTLLHNRVTVDSNTQGTSDGLAEDTTSQGTYGTRSLSISTISNNTADNAERADWELSRRKDPHLRLEDMSFLVGVDLQAETAAAMELQDLVTVNRRPGSGQDDISVDLRVASIDHNVSDGGKLWEVTLGLLEAATDQPGIWDEFTWDNAVWGY